MVRIHPGVPILMTKKTDIRISKEKAEMLYGELTKLQAWLTGWKDAGKLGPPGDNAVWQLRNILKGNNV